MDKIKELQKDQLRKEVIIDATGQSIGRLSSKVAFLLQGKASADYEPRKIGNTIVTVLNIKGIKVTGKKLKDKMYYR
jgi:large subunit ribosomal protein L13